MSAGNDYWPAKVETMRRIETELRAEIERLQRELEIQKQGQNAITNGLCARNERLRAALAGSVEVIKTWHNMSRIGLRGDPTLEAVWDIYWRSAPEMKPIREALEAAAPESRDD